MAAFNTKSERRHCSYKLGGSYPESRDPEPDEVAQAVEHALFAATPRRRYLVVPNPGQAERTVRKQIEQLVQLNESHRHTYDRATLSKMLDEALEAARPPSP